MCIRDSGKEDRHEEEDEMKITMTKTGETLEVNDSYGARLIEQGRAVLSREPKEKEKPAKKTGDA